MKSTNIALLAVITAVSLASSTTFAISPFKKAFDEKYVKSSGDADFQTAFKKAGCYTCHVKGEKKDVMNAYGFKLAEMVKGSAKDRIDLARKEGAEVKKAEEAKLLKEFAVALKKLEDVKAPSGETYDELFKAHRLPTADGAKSIRESSPSGS